MALGRYQRTSAGTCCSETPPRNPRRRPWVWQRGLRRDWTLCWRAPRSRRATARARAGARGLAASDLASSHHLDFGLDRAGRLDRLQDRDQIARADAERVEAVDELLQRHAF